MPALSLFKAGTTQYILGSPAFADVTIRPTDPSVGPIRIVAHNTTAADHGAHRPNVFVLRAQVNGREIDVSVGGGSSRSSSRSRSRSSSRGGKGREDLDDGAFV